VDNYVDRFVVVSFIFVSRMIFTDRTRGISR
jgi:hypothetical protein